MSYSMKFMCDGTAGAGSHPTVGINSERTVIAAWASTNSDNLYTKVGQVSADLTSISWGDQEKYDSGDSCAVSINNNNIVAGVHQSNGNYLYWKIGVVGTDANGLPTVTWKKSAKFTGGSKAKIAINDSGLVVIVWSSNNSTNLYCIIGQVNLQTYELTLGDSIQYDAGLHPTVSINDNNDIIFGHASSASTKLYYQLAQAGMVDNKYTLTSKMPGVNYDDGDQNCLTIDNKGVVWEVHRSSNSSNLFFAAAQLLSDMTLSPVKLSSCEEDPAQESSELWINMPSSSDSLTFGALVTIGNDNNIDVSIWEILGIPSISFSSLTPPSGYSATLFGGMVGSENVGFYTLGTDLGDFDGHPDGAIYFLGVPGIGTASLSVIPTNSQYKVYINQDETNALLCNTLDELSISIDTTGGVDVSVSDQKITGALVLDMMRAGNLIQNMVEMVSNSETLKNQWNLDAISTLYYMGLSPTVMTNMMSVCTYTPDCCTQLITQLQSITFSTTEGLTAQSNDNSWGCWACRTGLWFGINVGIVVTIVYISPAIEAGFAADVIADVIIENGYLEQCVEALNAVIPGITQRNLANNIIGAVMAGNIENLLQYVADATCAELGACNG